MVRQVKRRGLPSSSVKGQAGDVEDARVAGLARRALDRAQHLHLQVARGVFHGQLLPAKVRADAAPLPSRGRHPSAAATAGASGGFADGLVLRGKSARMALEAAIYLR